MYQQPGISERDYAQTSDVKNIRLISQCGNYKLFKSEYIKNHYSTLLLANENNKNYYKNLISVSKDNINIKLNASKLMIQYSELIKRFINELENTKENICNNKSKKFQEFKYDIMVLHWLEYTNYNDALNILSSLKNKSNSITNYDLEDRIDILNYKTNLSVIQFIYAKIDYSPDRITKQYDLDTIKSIIDQYQVSHDDNILNKVKEIELEYNEKIVEGFGEKDNYNNLILILVVLFIVLNK
jgi:type II secretory pathway component GspD/PulD (secretin)